MILAIGCSFTEGAELANPLMSAYPKLLADKFNTTVLNLGMGGASNDYIFRTVIEQTLNKKYELVVVQWTFPDRMEITVDGQIINLSMSSRWLTVDELDWVKTYYAGYHNIILCRQNLLSKILALDGYFKSTGQPYLFCNVMKFKQDELDNPAINQLSDKIDTQHFLGWPNEGLVDWASNSHKGSGGHPLELGHQRIAERINEHIRHLGWIS
jgi:hypothetical protein